MNEIEIIKYLLDEIEAEKKHNEEYKKEKEVAELKAENERIRTGNYSWYSKFMPEHLQREPKKSIIQDNAKMIRRLALKIYKEV